MAGGLGTDLIFAIMSEVNFWPNEEKAMERVNSTYIRITSRFDVKESLTSAGILVEVQVVQLKYFLRMQNLNLLGIVDLLIMKLEKICTNVQGE